MKQLDFVLPYEKSEDIPDEELLRLHKEYWTFIARNGLSDKPYIKNESGEPIWIRTCCFLCEYARRKAGTDARYMCAKFCPVKKFRDAVPEGHAGCVSSTSPYFKWSFFWRSKILRKLFAWRTAQLELEKT